MCNLKEFIVIDKMEPDGNLLLNENMIVTESRDVMKIYPMEKEYPVRIVRMTNGNKYILLDDDSENYIVTRLECIKNEYDEFVYKYTNNSMINKKDIEKTEIVTGTLRSFDETLDNEEFYKYTMKDGEVIYRYKSPSEKKQWYISH